MRAHPTRNGDVVFFFEDVKKGDHAFGMNLVFFKKSKSAQVGFSFEFAGVAEVLKLMSIVDEDGHEAVHVIEDESEQKIAGKISA